MAEKELRKLKRRDILQMLLVQCEETERLQQENSEIRTQLDTLTESYERLKVKLNIKDERLNQKDAKIAKLQESIEQMKVSREIELEEAGSIAEAALRINKVFEAAQNAAEQYLMNVRRLTKTVTEPKPKQALPVDSEPDREQPAVHRKIAGQEEPAVRKGMPEQDRPAIHKRMPEQDRLTIHKGMPEQEQTPEAASVKAKENRVPPETGWRAGIRKKQPRTRQIIPMNIGQVSNGTSGDIHG